MLRDRGEADQKFAERLRMLGLYDLLVLALPRGAVPVGAAIAWAPKVPLDLVIVRKVGTPDSPELAVAAIGVRRAR
jgi:putative phosphoribosyl transferase